MWALRLLTGPQAGQIFPLQPGKSTIGRGSNCEVKIDSTSVSKEHAVILVMEDKIILTDLNSRNGTFVNGVRIQNQRLNFGDKMSLHDVLIDVMQVPNTMNMSNGRPMMPSGGVYPAPPPAWAGNAAVRLEEQMLSDQQAQAMAYNQAHPIPSDWQNRPAPAPNASSSAGGMQVSANSLSGLFNNFRIYIDNVAMPGVYHIAQQLEYRYAIAALLGLYMFVVTALSTVPVVNTTRNNIRQESLRRARTIARQMAAANRQPLIEKNELQISIRSAELEEGVTSAILLNAKDGTIIAPATKRGEFVNKPFVNKARREDSEIAISIDDSTLGVSVPIKIYNPESGSQSVVAYAIILYDTGSLAMNSTDAFALFIENLGIAFVVGAFLFFFLMKLIEHPIQSLNAQLDEALREGRDDLKTPYHFPTLESLGSNINSALSRISDDGGEVAFVANRDAEAANLVRITSEPALAVNAIDDRVITTNPAFDRLVGGGVNLTGRPLTDIPDMALQENLRDLLPRMRDNVAEVATNQIPFPGKKYEVNGQAILSANEPAYYFIVFIPLGEG